ncbi:hypothetical protein HN747_00780 [archaeon]|jgi:hypothetical protein|nr:hypothetical protein [archaeon]
MDKELTKKELERSLEDRIVCETLKALSEKAKRWADGGALNHRVVAIGYMAETGVRNIPEGFTPPLIKNLHLKT